MLGTDAVAPLPWDVVVAYELQVHGSHGMAARDYPAMLAMVASGVLRPQELVGRVIGLADAPAALMAMDSPTASTAGMPVIDLDLSGSRRARDDLW
jgi:alcohol dehydrogenase